jgi:hypothetical protein
LFEQFDLLILLQEFITLAVNLIDLCWLDGNSIIFNISPEDFAVPNISNAKEQLVIGVFHIHFCSISVGILIFPRFLLIKDSFNQGDQEREHNDL